MLDGLDAPALLVLALVVFGLVAIPFALRGGRAQQGRIDRAYDELAAALGADHSSGVIEGMWAGMPFEIRYAAPVASRIAFREPAWPWAEWHLLWQYLVKRRRHGFMVRTPNRSLRRFEIRRARPGGDGSLPPHLRRSAQRLLDLGCDRVEADGDWVTLSIPNRFDMTGLAPRIRAALPGLQELARD
jgi:hypothetical protein